MRILLFGKNGQVGWELQKTLAPLGQVVAVDRPEIDFMDLKRLREFTLEIRPDLIVNAAAYTDVDKAESEPEAAMRINGDAPGVLAKTAGDIGAGLVHYSTDYVFDGEKRKPYREQDEPHPINIYGETKLAGERAVAAVVGAHWILRTSWLYGARGRNFFLTMLRLARERERITVVDDQIGSPTWCRALAVGTADMLKAAIKESQDSPYGYMQDTRGIYHLCAGGQASWYAFAKRILESDPHADEQLVERIEPVPSHSYPSTARRPFYSVLDTTRVRETFGVELAGWQEQLRACWRSSGKIIEAVETESSDG
jgi:dTDP-4-dehydrorhamnose reductase